MQTNSTITGSWPNTTISLMSLCKNSEFSPLQPLLWDCETRQNSVWRTLPETVIFYCDSRRVGVVKIVQWELSIENCDHVQSAASRGQRTCSSRALGNDKTTLRDVTVGVSTPVSTWCLSSNQNVNFRPAVEIEGWFTKSPLGVPLLPVNRLPLLPVIRGGGYQMSPIYK